MITQVYNCFTLSASQALVLNLLVELTQLLSDTDDNERKNKKINKPVIGADPSTRKGTIIFKLFKILNLFFNFLIFFNFMYILHLNFFFLISVRPRLSMLKENISLKFVHMVRNVDFIVHEQETIKGKERAGLQCVLRCHCHPKDYHPRLFSFPIKFPRPSMLRKVQRFLINVKFETHKKYLIIFFILFFWQKKKYLIMG